MHTDTTFHVRATTSVRSYIIDVPGLGPTMYLKIEGEGNDLVFIARDTDFFDKLANEAERLVREYIGDVPPLERLQLGIEIDPIPTGPLKPLPVRPTAGQILSAAFPAEPLDEEILRAGFAAHESEHDR